MATPDCAMASNAGQYPPYCRREYRNLHQEVVVYTILRSLVVSGIRSSSANHHRGRTQVPSTAATHALASRRGIPGNLHNAAATQFLCQSAAKWNSTKDLREGEESTPQTNFSHNSTLSGNIVWPYSSARWMITQG